MNLKDRITPKKVAAAKKANKSPAVKPPTVTVAAPQVTVDTKDFMTAINALAEQVNQALSGIAQAMAAHDARLVRVAAEQSKILKAIAERKDVIPQVNIPKRPDSFYVEFAEEDGETVGMRIKANPTH